MDHLVRQQLEEIENLMKKSQTASNPIQIIKQILELEASILLQINEPIITPTQQQIIDNEFPKP